MSRQYKTSKNFDRILTKLEKKDKQLYKNLFNKMNEVLSSPDIEHYKNLRYHKNPFGFLGCRKQFSVFQHDMKEFKRVQVGHFVLVFRHDKQNDMIYFSDFDHHDKIYKK